MSAGPPPVGPQSASRAPFFGWAIVGVVFAVNLGSVVFFNPVLAVFASPLRDEFGWTRGQVSLATTIGSIAGGLLAPLVGFIADRRGGRWVIAPGAVAMAVLLLALSGMQSLWQLYLFFALGRALSVGALQVAGSVAVSNWFVRRRSLTLAVANTGSRVGMATLPVLVSTVIAASGEWRDGWRALALVIAVAGVLPPLLLLGRRPEDRGLRPDGDPARLASAEQASLEASWTLRQAVGTRAYWFMGGAIAIALFGSGSVNFHAIPHLQDQGLPRTTAALVVSVYSLISAAGSVLGGLLALRFGARWTLVAGLCVMAAGVVLLLAADTVAVALLFAVSFGLAFGAFFTLSQVIYADYFGRGSLGAIYGSIQPAQLTCNALGPYAAGLWFDRTESYQGPFLLFAALFLLGALGLAVTPAPRRIEHPH